MDDINKSIDRILKFKRDKEKLALAPVKADDYVSPLNEASMKFKGQPSSSDMTPTKQIVKGTNNQIDNISTKQIVKGGTDRINTKQVQMLTSGDNFTDKIAKIIQNKKLAKLADTASEFGKKGLKSIPFLGTAIGLGTALATGDASAAIPVIDDIDSAGPERGSIEQKIENGTATPDEIDALLKSRGLN